MNLKDLASLGVRRAALFCCLCGEDTREGAPRGEGTSGVSLPTKATVVALLRTLVFVSRPLAPSHVEAYRSSVKVVHTGESEGTNWRYGHLVSSVTPFPLLDFFQR